MAKDIPQLKIVDVHSGEQLYSCPLEQREMAYHFAHQLEEIGVDFKIILPNSIETLGVSLGLLDELKREALRDECEQEIDSHN